MAKTQALAPKKHTEGGLMKWDEELAKYAADAAAHETATGSFVSLRAGQLSIAGQPIAGNKLNVIVIDHIFENIYYEGEFDPDNQQPPVCYAFGRTEDEMGPHDKSTKPQHEQCKGCENNVFGSAAKGKGKACKNSRRLALLSADGLTAKSIADGDVVYMKLPVTSTKGWAYYVKGLAATMNRPPFGVVTEISVVPDPKSQFKVVFKPVGPIPDDVLGAIMERRQAVASEIDFPYAPPSEQPVKLQKPAKARKF